MLPGATFLMSPAGWGALATVILALGAVTAGFWALYSYRKAKRLEAARWTESVLRGFYEERFREIKCALQYEYDKKLKVMLETQNRRDRRSGVRGDVALLEQLDMFLNYFEYLLYLEQEGHFEGRDGHAVFDYWFELLETEQLPALRKYIADGGFERVKQELNHEGNRRRREVRVALSQPSGLL